MCHSWPRQIMSHEFLSEFETVITQKSDKALRRNTVFMDLPSKFSLFEPFFSSAWSLQTCSKERMFEHKIWGGSKFTLLVQVWKLCSSPGLTVLPFFWFIWSLFLKHRKLDLFLKHEVTQTSVKLLVSYPNFCLPI